MTDFEVKLQKHTSSQGKLIFTRANLLTTPTV